MPWTPARFAALVLVPDDLLLRHVHQYQVGVVAGLDPALAHDVPNAGGAVAHPGGEVRKRALAPVYLVEHQREEDLDGRHTGGRPGVGDRLLLKRVRRVIGGHDLDRTLLEPPPECLPVRRGLERGVHLSQSAEAIVVGGVEEEVMRARFRGDDAVVRRCESVVIGDDPHFLGRGDMQDVEAVAMARREVDGAQRGGDGRLVIANP